MSANLWEKEIYGDLYKLSTKIKLATMWGIIAILVYLHVNDIYLIPYDMYVLKKKKKERGHMPPLGSTWICECIHQCVWNLGLDAN